VKQGKSISRLVFRFRARILNTKTEEERKGYLQTVLEAITKSGNANSNKYHILPSVTKWGLHDVELTSEKIKQQSLIQSHHPNYQYSGNHHKNTHITEQNSHHHPCPNHLPLLDNSRIWN
jgi:hypothetical protein